MADQMLKNKNKPREEIKPVDKERQKIELEKTLESIRRFNRVNEEIKESYDKQDAILKQREVDMRESLRKTEAKYYPDLDKDLGSDKDKDLGSDKDKDLDSDKDKDLDSGKDRDTDRESSSSDDFVFVQKPKTNKYKCEESNEELTLMNYNRHIQSLKHKKNARLYNRNKIIESANEDRVKLTNKDLKEKLDEQYPEEGIKYCDSCELYLDNSTAYNNHVRTLKRRYNVD